jgi:hypothetical protein
MIVFAGGAIDLIAGGQWTAGWGCRGGVARVGGGGPRFGSRAVGGGRQWGEMIVLRQLQIGAQNQLRSFKLDGVQFYN